MKGQIQNKKVLVRGKEVFIGVDVHKESWHVTVRVEEEEVFHGSIPSQYYAFASSWIAYQSNVSSLFSPLFR